MTFYPAKCSVRRISTNRRQIIDTSYQLHGHTLEVVGSSKYLGVTISEDLTWRKHIEDTAAKANKTLAFVRPNLSKCTSQVKFVAVTTMVRPRLEYSSTAWDPHLTSDVHTLEKFSDEQPDSSIGIISRVPWVRVPPTTTLHGQAINAFLDPAWTS